MINLDLASIDLPDAIAAVIEAWLDAQNVEDTPVEVDPPWIIDLEECIDYIGFTVIHWKDGKQRKKTNTIYELLDIRGRQMLNSRSKADYALHLAGIDYRGRGAGEIRIRPDSLPIFDYEKEVEEKWTSALLSYPMAKVSQFTRSEPYLEIDALLFFDGIEEKLPRAAELLP